ncbi:MAG TPA: gluconate 2-dehydrogenase subunit 3 family protein [Rhizomicrobium sp.]|nr:gluconate 2-dehydrogenase subunit 3 family protein [Rhizomicrobium sp.]
MPRLHRRELLGTAACFVVTQSAAGAVISNMLPWQPNEAKPPTPAKAGNWQFFTHDEGKAAEAIADRIIPPDAQFAGGKDAGCAVFVDNQLAGPYGRREGWYNRPPFKKGLPSQGEQGDKGPAQVWRNGLRALDSLAQGKYAKPFAQLADRDKDQLLHGLEDGTVSLPGADGKEFFQQALKDIQTGFFADPIYGGNKDMVSWRMIGFPGTRYDYRDWVDRHNQRYPLAPVSLQGRADWTEHGS